MKYNIKIKEDLTDNPLSYTNVPLYAKLDEKGNIIEVTIEKPKVVHIGNISRVISKNEVEAVFFKANINIPLGDINWMCDGGE